MLGKFTHYNKVYQIKKWDGQKLGATISVDTETTFVPFTETPDCVTIQAYDGSDTVYYVPTKQFYQFYYLNYDSHMVFHNFPFDCDVLCKLEEGNSHVENACKNNLFHKKIENETIWDTSILFRLLHLATIGYIPPMKQWSLKYLSDRF